MPGGHRIIFICGLHKSGTSLLFRILSEHPLVSGFKDTGVPQDEGQHLQSVYPAANFYGGPGKFGFHPEAHLTETSTLVSEENKAKLFSEWKRFWDTSKPSLVEKSPPNLVRTRFLQTMFSNSYFITVTRHPISVSLATRNWSRTSLHSLLKHWLLCHRIFQSDARYLRRVMIIKYETLIAKPHSTLGTIYSFLGIENYPARIQMESNRSQPYFLKWQQLRSSLLWKPYTAYLISRFEKGVKDFGYSMVDVELMSEAALPGRDAALDTYHDQQIRRR